MTENARRQILTLVVLAGIATVLVAAALPALTLEPGLPLPDLHEQSGPGATEAASTISFSFNGILAGILILLGLAAALSGVYGLLRGSPWQVILRYAMVSVLLLVFAGVCLFLLASLMHLDLAVVPPSDLAKPPAPKEYGPPLGLPPIQFIWLVWIALILGLVLLVGWAFRRRRAGRSIDPVRWEAERALRELRAGADLNNVVVRCYERMSTAVKASQGIERDEAMTARDFEALLQKRGLAPGPVHQLTRLFEAARYGSRATSAEDEEQAVECLAAIVRSAGGPHE